MKVPGKAFSTMTFTIGFGLCAVFIAQSCSKSSGGSSSKPTTATSEGKDVTQAFTLEVSGGSVDIPEGAFEEGTEVTFAVGTRPDEFDEDYTAASGVLEISAVNSSDEKLEVALAPYTLNLSVSGATGLADVEETNENICVLIKGEDGELRRWANADITIDEDKGTLAVDSIWLGTFQALYCGDDAFTDVPQVNEDGTDVIEEEVVVERTSSATTDGTCNDLTNQSATQTANEVFVTVPTGTGGTITDGTYKLVEFNIYDGSSITPISTFAFTIEITAGNELQFVGSNDGGTDYHSSFTFAPSGTATNLDSTCTTAAETEIVWDSYTAGDTSITFYSSTSAAEAVFEML
jgi:hypothetical protein